MANLFFQADGFISERNLPTLQNIQDVIYVEKFEEDSYGHWLFEGSPASLIDRVNNRSLTLQTGATVQPVYSDKYVNISAKNGNSLQSSLLDSSVIAFTLSGVVGVTDTAISILAGTLGSSTDLKGAGIFSSALKLFSTVRTGVSSLNSGLALDITKPIFFSISVNKTTLVVNMLIMQGGIFYEKTGALSAYVDADAALSFGNSRYTSTHSVDLMKYYEAIIHDKSLSLVEMKAIANRVNTRQLNRGVTF